MFLQRGQRRWQGGVNSHGGFCENAGGVGVLDDWASN